MRKPRCRRRHNRRFRGRETRKRPCTYLHTNTKHTHTHSNTKHTNREEVLGRTCRSCHAFRALEDFTGNKRKKTVPGICIGCKTEDDLASTQRGSGSANMGPRKRIALISEDSTLRRSARAQGLERVSYHEGAESDTRSDSDDDERVISNYLTDSSCVQLTLGISPVVMTRTGEI